MRTEILTDWPVIKWDSLEARKETSAAMSAGKWSRNMRTWSSITPMGVPNVASRLSPDRYQKYVIGGRITTKHTHRSLDRSRSISVDSNAVCAKLQS